MGLLGGKMMKKKSSFLLIAITIVIMAGTIFFIAGDKKQELVAEEYDNSKVVKNITVEALAVTFKDSDHLLSASELVVVGKPIKSKNYVVKDSEGLLKDRFTITQLEITKVLEDNTGKNYKIGNVIEVAEPTYVIDVPGKGLTKYSVNDYMDLKKKEEYLLALREDVKFDDLYVILGLEEGKHPINPEIEDKSSKNVTHGNKSKKEKFRNDLFKKFNLN
jgi:hypothetical protein